MNQKSESIVVIGCARSGLAAAKLAKSQGNQVTVYDQKEYGQFNESVKQYIDELQTIGVTFLLGKSVVLTDYELGIISPGVPLDLPFIVEAVEKGFKIVGELEYAYTFCKAPVVAITGTNGKTTTTSLVGQIIKAYNDKTFVVGNIGRAFSEDVLEVPEEGVVVAEVSSFQLETIENFYPRVSAVLNITPDHLNRHKTMENYCEAKYNVFKNQTSKDYVILNQNDLYYSQAVALTKAKIVTFNSEGEVLYGAYTDNEYLYENISGVVQSVCRIDELKIVGKHNIENVLAAIAICKVFGVPNEVIAKELKAFNGVEHRLEFVCSKKGVDYFNDSKATNVGAAIPGLTSMHKPIHLIAGGLDKKTSFKEWIALFEGRVKHVYVIGETKDQLIKECLELNFKNITPYVTFEEAIKAAYDKANTNECVLLSPACASWDMFESYEQRGDIFKEIVMQLEG